MTYRGPWKRGLDILVAAAGICLLSPVIAAIALAVRIRYGAPVLFRQVRPGLHERPFTILKFRTMSDSRDPDGRLRPDGDRLDRFGRALRATSLDELPELWNVLRGDMSMVGPRPLLMAYLPRYTGFQRRRHDVRPGITGLAQVSGRNNLGWEEKFALDVTYVDTCSFALDMRILMRTAAAVIRQSGINAAGYDTAPEFTGLPEKK